MDNRFIDLISPITKVKTIVYTKMQIKILHHILGNNECELQVEIYDDTFEYKKIFTYLMSGVNYLEWSSDSYLINFVQSKLRNEAL